MNRRDFLNGSLGLAALALGRAAAAEPFSRRAPGGGDVLVVGAGIAGLVAAYRLQQQGLAVTVLEASNRVGGRMTTDVVQGYVIDRGANFLSSTYGVLLPLIEALGLGPDLVTASEWSATVRDGVPRRLQRNNPNSTLSSGLLDPADWAVLGGRFWSDLPAQAQAPLNDYSAWTRYDDQDARAWSDGYYTPQVTQYIVEPMMQGFYFQGLEGMSRALPTAVLAHGYHQPVTQALRGGLGSLPGRLAARLDVHLNCPATQIEVQSDRVLCFAGGREFSASHLVLATTTSVARQLYRQADALESALMANRYSATVMLAIATDRQWNHAPGLAQAFGLMVPGVERDVVTAVGFGSNKNPGSAPQGELLNVHLGGDRAQPLLDAPEPLIRARVLKELSRWLPGLESSIRFTRLYRWPEAEPLSPVGRCVRLRDYRRRGNAGRRVWLAGDFMSMPWTEGAADSAVWASDRILAAG